MHIKITNCPWFMEHPVRVFFFSSVFYLYEKLKSSDLTVGLFLLISS